MIIYPGENEVKLVQSTASASTLISSITGEIKEYVASKFPRGFFKSVYIDTAETIHAQNRNRKHNENLNKIQYPNIAITPEISLDDPIGGMEKAIHLASPNLYLRKDMRRSYTNIVIDPEEKFSIYYTSDYITTNYNFRITTNKFVQNMNLAYYIKSRFQVGLFQYLNGQFMNTEIPKSYIKIIASMFNWDLNNEDDMDLMRLYLISTGTADQMITKKINAFTGKVGFFMNEKTNFLTLLTDLDAPSSIIRESMSEGEYTINFKLQVSAWLPNAFIMSIDQTKFFNLDTEIIAMAADDAVSEQDEGFYSTSIPNLTLNRDKAIYFENATGDQVIGTEIFFNVFTYDLNTPVTEVLLGDYLKDDLKKVHAYMMAHNFSIEDLLYIKVQNRSGVMDETKVTIDYELLTINILDSEAQDFAVTIHADRALFESMLIAIDQDQFFFSDSALAVLRINEFVDLTDDDVDNPTQEELNVPIYTFTNEKDLYTIASKVNGEWRSNVLRVYTVYGIGFLGLVHPYQLDSDGNILYEDGHTGEIGFELLNPNASSYRIVIGYVDNDPEGEPIIRALERL